MARKRANYRPRKKTIYQDSPFLDLPGEIRTLIYRQALFRPTPIDLWPHAFTTYNRNDQDLDPALRTRFFKNLDPENVTVREQKDLQYVRKEMATGLLATCTQIFNEAQHIFWAENRFRFSGDSQWYGARRFLASIGPRVISQLKTVELFAPVRPTCMSWTEGFTEWSIDHKNHPKMHMVKAPYTGEHQYHNWWGDSRGDNTTHVLDMLKIANLSIAIKLILPTGFGIMSGLLNYNDSTGTWDTGFEPLYPVDKAIRDFSKRIELVIEDGASIHELTDPKHVTDTGIDLVCLPGSSINAKIVEGDDLKVTISEEMRWVDPYIDLDIYLGVPQLFDLPGPPEIANLGGKALRSTGRKKSERRRLRGFGGSRFIQVTGWDCTVCRRTVVTTFVDHSSCPSCGSYRPWDPLRDVIILGKMKRALRRDESEWNENRYEGLLKPSLNLPLS